jgi:hypothetical protein
VCVCGGGGRGGGHTVVAAIAVRMEAWGRVNTTLQRVRACVCGVQECLYFQDIKHNPWDSNPVSLSIECVVACVYVRASMEGADSEYPYGTVLLGRFNRVLDCQHVIVCPVLPVAGALGPGSLSQAAGGQEAREITMVQRQG